MTNFINNNTSAFGEYTNNFKIVNLSDVERIGWVSNGIAIKKKDGTTVNFTGSNSAEVDYLQMKVETASGPIHSGKVFAKIAAVSGQPQYVPFEAVASVSTVVVLPDDVGGDGINTFWTANLVLTNGATATTGASPINSVISQFE